jgi:hypothetical protein
MLQISQIPATAQLWVYLADRCWTAAEQTVIDEQLSHFVSSWQSHGTPLQAYYDTVDSLVVVLAVDGTQHDASGCSIDSSVKTMKELGARLGIDFFCRTNIIPCHDKQILDTTALKAKIATGDITADTLIYNLLITIAAELGQLKTPLKNTWVKRYL